MAIRDLLVYVDQADSAFLRLQLAADLAARNASRLTALYVCEPSWTQLEQHATAELSAAVIDQPAQRTNKGVEDAATRLQAALESSGRERDLVTAWLSVDGPPSVVVPQHARYADLCIVGRDWAPNEKLVDYAVSEELVFVSGRPVLLVPPVPPCETLGRHIAVAWNSSRAAARALNDALPLIERSERTTVLTVNPADYIDRPGSMPVEQVVEHLRRHGASANLVIVENVSAQSIADALQDKAREIEADLIVAGAFGDPRPWEKLLGNVTCQFLERATLPVFTSY